jgi:metal-responsive CopG/Arc/MetJ family transcriptional regulator
MSTQKVAITLPEELMKDIDLISKTKGLSRSRYIASALSLKVADEKRRLITEAYDNIFSDKKILEEQTNTAKWFEGVGTEGGQEW